MLLFRKYLIQTYARPALEQRLAVLAVLQELGCALPLATEDDAPPFDAPDGVRLPRVYAVDIPESFNLEQRLALQRQLLGCAVVQYVLPV